MDERRKNNQPMIECVIACLKGLKDNTRNHKPYEYLLGQAIRQYAIPIENWHLTCAAQQQWNNLTSKDINDFFFHEFIQCDKANQTPVMIFNGARKKGDIQIVLPNQRLRFNSVFSCEHTIPVKMIQDRLLMLENVSEETVVDILDKMHITRMLKEEDHKITEKYQREGTFEEIVEKVYNSKGIKLV